MKRKKYDTEALVGQLKSERRSGILITFGVLILAGLGALYFTGVGKEDIPEVPGDAALESGNAETGAKAEAKPAEPPKEEKVAGVAEEPAADKAPSFKPGVVHIMGPKKPVTLMVNDQAVKVAKKKDMTLPPGKHVFKLKAGKKVVTQEIEVTPGGDYKLLVDPKKKKLTLK